VNVWSKSKSSWQPKPIDPPKVDPDLHHLDGLTRSAESFRYSILSIEWWVSPNGRLREWVKHNTHLAAWLIIPAILVVPVVTFILWQLAKWVTMLTSITGHLIILPILALVAALVILVVIAIVKAIFK
jgi:hypothetical protein